MSEEILGTIYTDSSDDFLRGVKQVGNIVDGMRGRNPDNPSDRTAGIPLEQMLEPNSQGISNTLTSVQKDNMVLETVRIKSATKDGYIDCNIGGVADLSYPSSNTRRGRVQENGDVSPTITAKETGVCRIESPYRIRKLTPKECWRLMGFSDSAFEAAESVVSNSQLYKQAGNSIVVDVIYYIFVELYKAMPYLFDDLKLSSFFSGIGAFEVALDRLYDDINNKNFHMP